MQIFLTLWYGEPDMITVCADSEAMSRAAAELFAQESLKAVQARGRFVVLLSGGGTPRRTYQLLASSPLREQVPWHAVHVFWGDERSVPSDDPRSNARMARQELLDHVSVPVDQIHPIPYRSSPNESAVGYEKLLHIFFSGGPPRFDLVFLGLGDNGHTASLFPWTAVVDELKKWVSEVYVEEDDLYRVTLTAPVINQAELIIFLVSGSGKAAILRDVLERSPDPHSVPARLIKPDGRLLWLVDRSAARLLQSGTAV
jgi:6-phosphogluconolactonase